MTARRAGQAMPGADALPQLRSFARAYLHQDLAVESGSAVSAARAWVASASAAERAAMAEELTRASAVMAALSLPAARRFVERDLGAAWVPASRAELAEVLAVLRSRD